MTSDFTFFVALYVIYYKFSPQTQHNTYKERTEENFHPKHVFQVIKWYNKIKKIIFNGNSKRRLFPKKHRNSKYRSPLNIF